MTSANLRAGKERRGYLAKLMPKDVDVRRNPLQKGAKKK